MERNFRINWSLLVQEAKRRRKEQGLTQERLAAIADVSTPTVSRFEGGEQNIQMSSVLAILEVLGMVEKPGLVFPDKEERYDSDCKIVQFTGQFQNEEILCAVSADALADHFGAAGLDRRSLLTAFRKNREAIEQLAQRKFTARQTERDGSLLVRTQDVM